MRASDPAGAHTTNLISGAIKLHVFHVILGGGVCVIHYVCHDQERRRMRADAEEA